MLEEWQKTPLDLGLAPDQLDPVWEPAMFILKAAVENQRSMTFSDRR